MRLSQTDRPDEVLPSDPRRVRVAPATLYGDLLDRPDHASLRDSDGHRRTLPLERWLGPATAADDFIASAVDGPVLDVGCGPGRLLAALRRHGTWAIGLDHSPQAIRLANRLGRPATLGCIFDPVPGGRTWQTALLLDGNIGIGGDPVRLLRRLGAIVRPGGQIVAEVGAPGTLTGTRRVRLEAGQSVSDWFAWGCVSVDSVDIVGAEAGLAVTRTLELEDRWFAWLA